MARTNLSVQQIVRTGLNPTYGEANAEGHKVAWSRDLFLYVKQGEGDRDVTIPTTRTVDGLAVADREVTVPGDGERIIGPFTEDYVQADGSIHVDFDAVTNTTIAALRLGL